MTSAQVCILISIAVYLIAMLAIGIVCSKRNNTVDDFYLGGRRLGPVVTAMSAEASDMSSWLLMGLPGVAYLTGVADPGWTAIGLGVGTYINWLVVARRLRRYSARIGAITVPDFFSRRFGEKKHILTAMAAILIIVFFVPYTASGFAACGKLFSSLFGMNYMTAMIISAVVIVAYTTAGGFFAASATDFVQSIIMTVAIVFVLVFSTILAGGIDVVVENAKALPGYLSLTASYIEDTGKSEPYNLLHIITTLSWGLGYFGMPHILLRFMAVEKPEKIKLSRRVATIWVVISMAVSIFIGVAGNAMIHAGRIESQNDSERILIAIATAISKHGVLPALIAGIILAGLLAAIMSTADSQMLAASSSVSQNIVREVFVKDLSEKKSMLVARCTLIGIAFVAVILAWNQNSSVFRVVSFAWAGFGATFGPVVLTALFWKRSNKYGALAGMITGGVMIFVWKFAISKLGGVFAIYELLPAFLCALIAIVVVSLLTKAPEQEIVDEFEAVSAEMKQK